MTTSCWILTKCHVKPLLRVCCHLDTSLKLPEVSVNVNEAATLVLVHHPVLSKCLRCGSGGVDKVFIRSDCRCRDIFKHDRGHAGQCRGDKKPEALRFPHEPLFIPPFRLLVFSRHKTALGGSACAVRCLQTNTEGEVEWEERGRTTKSRGCLSGAWLPTTHPGACKPATMLDYTRTHSLKAHKENQSSLFLARSRSDRCFF